MFIPLPDLYKTNWLFECSFTSTETVGLLGTGVQDIHLDFHTAPGLDFHTAPGLWPLQ